MPGPAQFPVASSLVEGLLVGEVLTLAEGLAEGRAEEVGVCGAGLVRSLMGGRGTGLFLTGGGALVVAGGREAGDVLRVAVGTGRRNPSPFSS
ncbi:hypothetical protein [Streptomyces sp. NPDC046197]|uniref:hypothetical protein n=1 Tax=Streptomyces sp. NPDC046197 TaxID=3154337 RepID=UPI0033D75338